MIDKNTALLLIDLQIGFDNHAHWGGNRNNPNCEQVCLNLLTKWRTFNLPIFHIQHNSTDTNSPLHPNQIGNDFKPLTAPINDEIIIGKTVNSAFIGTHLEHELKVRGINTLVIVGLTTNHCVSTTARMAGNLGFTVFVVADGTATFDRVGFDGTHYDSETVHRVSLANLHGEFATVLMSDELLANKFWQANLTK
ncbi:cysteine hydrolase [Moraxella nasibovis]|uniref:cysteine hydrolase family protein n=1 Tax=Moraxella nasibovis TaxID=2904120 RepID=UPI00240EB1B5|nr:cysteine hydrolase family protein [Moraxella nasibovis]WFF37734.1 cysteine hydrolase [Moraxella nasibovis]